MFPVIILGSAYFAYSLWKAKKDKKQAIKEFENLPETSEQDQKEGE